MSHARIVAASVIALVMCFAVRARATDYYIAPDGLDTNDGSIGAPFATITKAIPLTTAGDAIYMRGGTYNIPSKITIQSKSGTDGHPIKLWAYSGEQPILDFSDQAENSSNRGIQINNSANYWSLKGLTIQNAGDNGVYTEGDYGVFDQIVTRWNHDSGFQLHSTASYNLVQNCDSYENYDALNRGENADGFAVKAPTVGPGNIFRGDRSFRNSDDGWDMFEAEANGVLIENCWAYDNGVDPESDPTTFNGDGNAIKLGRDSGSHILIHDLVWSNPHNGYDINGNGFNYNAQGRPTTPNGATVHVFNSTAYNNGLASGSNWRFDEAIQHVLRNNISLGAGVVMDVDVAQQLNTWNGIPVDNNDFLSLDDTIARGSRRIDGSLPVSDFLRLKSDSNLVDQGTPLSYTFAGKTYVLSYKGDGPDLGAYETGVSLQVVTGDYNFDGIVNAADYTVWRNSLGDTGEALPADGNNDHKIDELDYGVWKNNFGHSLLNQSLSVATAVAEPSSWLLLLLATAPLAAVRRRLRKPVA